MAPASSSSDFNPPPRESASSSSNSKGESWKSNGESKPALANNCAGLHNLTNTCYMNSSIVCLANVPLFRDYFLSNRYIDSLKVRDLVSLKTKGEFARSFHSLLSELWNGRNQSLRPTNFKALCGKLDDRFAGYTQHDSMEFMEFLIDSLREDCNMVKGPKNYIERAECGNRTEEACAIGAANEAILRNDSVVDDMFVGFTKTSRICPDPACGHEEFVFDSILSLKVDLALQREKFEKTLETSVVSLSHGDISRHTVTVNKEGSVWDIIDAASQAAGIESSNCLLAKVRRNQVDFLPDVASLDTVDSTDKLVLYQLTAEAAEIFKLTAREDSPCLDVGDHVVVERSFMSANAKNERELDIGMRGVIHQIDRDGDAFIEFEGIDKKQWVKKDKFSRMWNLDSKDSNIRKFCPKRKKAFTLKEVTDWPEFGEHPEFYLPYWKHEMQVEDVSLDMSQLSACTVFFRTGRDIALVGIPLLLCIHRELTAADLRKAIGTQLERHFGEECSSGWGLYQAMNGEDALPTNAYILCADGLLKLSAQSYFVVEFGQTEHQHILPDFEEIANVKFNPNVVTLQQCLDNTTALEQLSQDNLVKCARCKKEAQSYFKTDIWSLPPILVMHLKRFEPVSYDDWKRLNKGVSFPLENLDLTRFSRGVESFPEGECLRAGREVEIFGLESEKGKLLNGLRGTAVYLDVNTKRFCVRINEDDPSTEWKRVQPKNLKPVPLKEKPEVKPFIYDLVSLAKHVGRAGFGHYVAYARSCEDGLWRIYDDDDVREVKPETVESERVGAYVLVYLRREFRPAAWGPPKDG